MKSQMVNELLARELTRKEFIMQVGSALLVMFGVSGLLKGLMQMKNPAPRLQHEGYGTSAYGGLKR